MNFSDFDILKKDYSEFLTSFVRRGIQQTHLVLSQLKNMITNLNQPKAKVMNFTANESDNS